MPVDVRQVKRLRVETNGQRFVLNIFGLRSRGYDTPEAAKHMRSACATFAERASGALGTRMVASLNGQPCEDLQQLFDEHIAEPFELGQPAPLLIPDPSDAQSAVWRLDSVPLDAGPARKAVRAQNKPKVTVRGTRAASAFKWRTWRFKALLGSVHFAAPQRV